MKEIKRDYSELTLLVEKMGFVPYNIDNINSGIYTIKGLNAPIDLSACANDEKSIMITAIKQLSEKVDNSYHMAIENDLNN